MQYLVGIIMCMTVNTLSAQNNSAEQLLLQNYRQAVTDSEKIYQLYPLINFYYAFNYDKKADSLRELQIITAEESGSVSLKLGVLFPAYNNCVSPNSSNRRFNKELDFANQALEYAKSLNKSDYVALAYADLAEVYNFNGQPDLALKNADNAFTIAISTHNDSVKVVTALRLGEIFMFKKDLVTAFQKYSSAFDIANNRRNPYLLSAVYNHFSNLYIELKSTEEGKQQRSIEQAKEYLFKSIALNKESGNMRGLAKDYITMSTKILDLVPAKNYLEKAMLLADSMHDPVLKLAINRVWFVQYMINDSSENAFKFLRSHPDIELLLRGPGEYNYEWVIGEIFLYSHKYDSAFVHFKKAEPVYDLSYNISGRINFLSELADCYRGLKLYKEAISYYTTTFQLASRTMVERQKSICLDALQQLYYQTGDFRKAYEYAQMYYSYTDSVNTLNKDKDLVLLEIDNERKRVEKENELIEIAKQRRHDAQYMLITITVAGVFLLLVLLGLFTVSATTIRVLGFFSFIFLFELITLLLDNWIHERTHGEPWKIWLIKIAIISLLYPFHHWLEHKLIHYLLNKKLIHVGSLFSLKRIFKRSKKQTAPVAVTTEAAGPIEDIQADN